MVLGRIIPSNSGLSMFNDTSNFQSPGGAHDFVQLKRAGRKSNAKSAIDQGKIKGQRNTKTSPASLPAAPAGEGSETQPSGDGQAGYPKFERDARLKKRINPQTGPTSEQGKSAVSKNALKHGGYATPTSEDASYVMIEQMVFGVLEPEGVVQCKIANSIAHYLWRIANIEASVLRLEGQLDTAGVRQSQLADALEFPFSSAYREALLIHSSEFTLMQRIRTSCEGVFSRLLDSEGSLAKGDKSQASLAQEVLVGEANERARRVMSRSKLIFAKGVVFQHMESEFFEEFDAVMLDARLGQNSIGAALKEAGQMMPLVEYWVYRNYNNVMLARSQLIFANRLELLTDPRIERALMCARASLKSLLSDFIYHAPNAVNRVEMLGYWK